MATETESGSTRYKLGIDGWIAGAGGGFVGGILMGLVMQFVMPTQTLQLAIPAMYGIEGPALGIGWALHQFHAVVLGVTYVALVQFEPIRGPAKRVVPAIGLGIGYGVVTTFLLGAILMPVWLSAVGFAAMPPLPNVGIPQTPLSLLAHVIYAIPVAVAYAATGRT